MLCFSRGLPSFWRRMCRDHGIVGTTTRFLNVGSHAAASHARTREVPMMCRRTFGRWVACVTVGIALGSGAGRADAEPVRCQRAILKAASKLAESEMRTLVRCE